MTPIPVTLQTARAFVAWTKRHLPPLQRATFAIGVATEDGTLVGVAIAGRPVARSFDDGFTVEVTRLSTDGTANACSALLGVAWRAARAMGNRRLITYTLASEPGTSLRAAGLRRVAERPARSGWNTPSRPRATHGADGIARVLWEIIAPFPGDGGAR
ncbi:XF1762 family protein [Microtetraspora malaysiensis]|uniref:XF1762 family protein n=1 Tax=Microtetraspora malaysiensis TaxID=161358 RepID=UPI003D93BF1E